MSQNSLIPKETTQLLIENLLSKMCIEESRLEITSTCEAGDNWIGLMYNVKVDGKQKKGGRVHLDLIVKLAPHQEVYRSLFGARFAYEREIYIYNSVLPEFKKLQEEKNIHKIFQPYAKCYLTTLDNQREAIVMEDMKEKGYRVGNHRAIVDYQHARLVMRHLGRFHALSFAMKDQKPIIFDELGKNCKESYFNNVGIRDPFIEILSGLGGKILQTYDSGEEKEAFARFIQNLPDVVTGIFIPEKSGRFAVINHGDLQMRNLLFRYENNQLIEMCMIDWQISRLASPVFDIFFFICACTDRDFREKHYHNLIVEYYEELSVFLRELGSDPERLFPFSVLEEHLRKLGGFGLYMAIITVALNIKEATDIPDVYNFGDEEKIRNNLGNISNPIYFSRIKDIVADFMKYEYEF